MILKALKWRTLTVNLALVLVFAGTLLAVWTDFYETPYHDLDYMAVFGGNIVLDFVVPVVIGKVFPRGRDHAFRIAIENLAFTMAYATLTIGMVFATAVVWPIHIVLAVITAILAVLFATVTYYGAFSSFKEYSVEEIPLIGLTAVFTA